MHPEDLKRELERRGLQLLSVGRHHSDPDVITVYLNGNAGQWADGAALRTIRCLAGVRRAIESVTTPTIIMAHVQPENTPAVGDRLAETETERSDSLLATLRERT